MLQTTLNVYAEVSFFLLIIVQTVAITILRQTLRRQYPNLSGIIGEKTSTVKYVDKNSFMLINLVVFGDHKKLNDRFISILCYIILTSGITLIIDAIYLSIKSGTTI